MKVLYPLSIIILLGVVFYQHFYAKYQHQVLADQIEMLEQKQGELINDYETKIAELKFEYESQLSANIPRFATGPESLRGIVQEIRERARDSRQVAVLEARQYLGLNDQEYQNFNKVLDVFEANKRSVLQLSAQEGQSFTDKRYIKMLEDYRTQLHSDLEEVLGHEKMQQLKNNKNLLEKLGL